MKAVEIKPGIYWVGAIDWAIRDFHGYVIPNGTTYNNYIIMDEQITLLDTVKHDFSDITIGNIKSITDPSKIVNVIINHIETDHVSSIDKIMELAPDATIYISDRGKKGLDRFFDLSKWNVKVVKTGDTLNIGKRTLLFLETPMLHWPDSMMTYVKEAKLLISQDAFGQHLATAARFDDEFIECASHAELEDSVVDYYANILMPFGQLIKAKISELQRLGLEIDMIAPDHGIIWRKQPGRVIRMYQDMADGKASLRIAIIYDTMWHSTERMTLPIMQGIKDEGVDCTVIKLRATPGSIAVKELWKSRGCLIGTPTLNNTIFPSVAGFLTYLRGLRPKNRIMGAFGSYGWGGGAVKEVYEEFKKMGLETVEPGLQVVYKPSAEDEKLCYEFGRDFARKAKEYHKKFE
ncbi:MAG: MBL fold metallo-hydrolase [Nitrospirae bacterium CG22_combo_CG10-13_8_21_14_all_44_11]|nr:FprA family A-type flavoprotein [Nitrospirota bacterium]OIO31616.1 MAG: MBL fold metallo-hydrolase [Nitrospirae bacterium CG1_02_44_142]PIP70411.1 MAG: MBL fold metallo-hydrolase [Nitrospirae bacterium CG22_combo_CG10-13_8_21_14_all_44_11]PIV44401.1 MAG: MBL fold metallo-hydrolase [Nitrospirae bacterium CG02_land_8_20_14_3_00_44_33]PIV65880.1 MAG: MBL fold metallo-hydrolase [Nitrospirae bacterium CG01_land_8_20_14_3_00_44_22]PIW89700.1 MAG: MBL fold metallo-hydrolase [Nitrospirae bacterium 